VVSTFEVKTDTKWLYQLLGQLSDDKIASAIACMYGGGEMMRKFEDLHIPTFNLDAPRTVSMRALWRTYRLIGSYKPDIVHTHMLRADLYGALAARLSRTPTALSTVYAIGPYRRAKVRRLDGFLDLLCKLFATDVLAVSNAVRADVIDRWHWPTERITTINTGITFPDRLPDESVVKRIRNQLQISESAPLILTLARLSYEKGIDVLVRCAAMVHREIPSARFVVAGDGPMKQKLQAQIRALGLKHVVHLPGFRKDTHDLLAASDLFVLPSLMEGMPNAILEAYAAQRPIIATRAGGSAEAVKHQYSGLLVRPNDPQDLASAVIRCLRDKELCKRLSCNGSKWAEEHFSVRNVAKKYENLYRRLSRNPHDLKHKSSLRSGISDSIANTV
jgi:glycosyltransferase involved in cell wall biosynthesis